MKLKTIDINSRYYLAPTSPPSDLYDVCDRARDLQFLPSMVFSAGSEAECREWVLRNCEEPGAYTSGLWEVTPYDDEQIEVMSNPFEVHVAFFNNNPTGKANATLFVAAPKLLALLEQYHASMPTKESGKLICAAKGWTIQD